MQRIIPHELARTAAPTPRDTANALFLVGGVLLFLLVALASTAFFFLIRSETAKQTEYRIQIDEKVAELRASDVLGRAKDLEGRLETMRHVLDSHVFSTNGIRLFEDAAHPEVRFSGFAFSRERRTVTTAATASGFSAVAHQITILRARPEVERVAFGGLSVDTRGRVEFSLDVTVKPAFLTMVVPADFGLPVSP